MELFDVVFPINLGPLTYKTPSHYAGLIKPGMLIKAEIKKSGMTGIVIGRSANPPKGHIKEITGIVADRPVFSASLLSLLKWISGYYITADGIALKSMLPADVFSNSKFKSRQPAAGSHGIENLQHSSSDLRPLSASTSEISEITSPVKESISKKTYKTYLLHAPTTGHEIRCLMDSIEGVRNVIVLVPETAHIEKTAPALIDQFGGRIALLHGKLTKAQKRNAFNRIISGESDIVIGTRIAVFAPLDSVSMISVFQEHNRSYKNLEGVRYNARDVAVMRGYIEKATVLLSSTTPSIESLYNTTTGKYTILKHNIKVLRPKAEILNMKTAKKVAPYLSKRAIEASASCINKKESILFLINRKGYSMVQCKECGHIETCHECSVPLVYHKDKRIMKCHRCGHASRPKDTCRKCNSPKLEMLGAGTQRIASDIKKHLNIEPLRIDKDIMQKDSTLNSLSEIVQNEEMIVATKVITKSLSRKGNIGLCAFLNPDTNLHFPDFRSSERLFQELWNISEQVMHDGLLIIQTAMPESHIYRSFRKYDYDLFCKEEMLSRKTLSYPPFSRLTLITITSKIDMGKDIMNAVNAAGIDDGGGIEVIGPFKTSAKGTNHWKLLLKSPAKVRLHVYVHNLLKCLGSNKNLRVIVDVDPISI